MITIFVALVALAGALGVPTTTPSSSIDWAGIIQSSFHRADTNGDGIFSKPEALALLMAGDKNGDRKLSADEYVATWVAINHSFAVIGRQIFHEFDLDKSGFLDRTDANRIYAKVDVNGNGEVNSLEFDEYLSIILDSVQSGPSTPIVQFVSSYMPTALTDQRFPIADANHDANLTLDEDWQFFLSLDMNGDRKVGKIEFVISVMNFSRLVDYELWPDVFDALDFDKNGFIQRGDITKLFSFYDLDGDGLATLEDVKAGFQEIDVILFEDIGKISPGQGGYGFDTLDGNKDGWLTLNELWFNSYRRDTDEDGRISLPELSVLVRFYQEDVKNATAMFFRSYDNNSDGFIERDDVGGFLEAMDSNGDGRVTEDTYSTFIEVMFVRLGIDIRTEAASVDLALSTLSIAFHASDLNHDHKLSKEEQFATALGWDKNGDNKVTKQEYLSHFATMFNKTPAGEQIFNKFDSDKNGFVERSDMDAWIKMLDKDGDGFVDIVEYIEFVAKMYASLGVKLADETKTQTSAQLLQAQFNEADTNKDGNVTIEEQWADLLSYDTNGDKIVNSAEYQTRFAYLPTKYKSMARELFSEFDYDRSHYLDNSDVAHRFPKMDADGNGLVTFPEYSNFVTKVYADLGVDIGPQAQRTVPMSELHEHFLSADSNNDKLWTVDEKWAELLRHDADGDGLISIAEYKSTWSSLYTVLQQMAPRIFSAFDTNGDGFLNRPEINLGNEKLDTNRDGFVSVDEYIISLDHFLTELGIHMKKSDMVPMSDLQAHFAAADYNHDQKWTVDEKWAELLTADTGDGQISLAEYQTTWSNFSTLLQQTAPKIFVYFDADKDGWMQKNDIILGADKLDKNGDGFVSLKEYTKSIEMIFSLFGITVTQSVIHTPTPDMGFSEIDTNKDGIVTFEEEWAAIVVFDKNGDNRISQAEYVTSVPHNIAPFASKIFARFDSYKNGFFEKVDIRRFLALVDTNGDGKLTSQEYQTFVKGLLIGLGMDPSILS